MTTADIAGAESAGGQAAGGQSAGRARRAGAALAAARAESRAALIGYLPVGFPTVAGSAECLTAMFDAGCDLLEVGIPYSDPVIDGPTVQAASERALRQGTRVADTFGVVERISDAGGTALVMTYWNPVYHYGVDAFARDLAAAGGAGLITPDLLPEAADEWLAASDEHGLDRVFLVAPSSTDERLRTTTAACRGFVYAASTMGVTGARDTVSQAAPALVARVRGVSDLPVGVGLGIRSGDQAAEVAGYADAVIVGSAFVTAAGESGPAGVARLAEELAAGVRRPHPA